MASSQTVYRPMYEPESSNFGLHSNSSVDFQPLPRRRDHVLYDNTHSANLSVPMGASMTSVHNGESVHGQPINPSENYCSVYQPSDADSVEPSSSRYSINERLDLGSIHKQGTMESYRRDVVVPGSGRMLQQPRDSLQNLSLPQGSQPSSHNGYAHPITSQYHLHNQSGMLETVNHNTQPSRPAMDTGVNQYTSHEQAPKVVLPNRSAYFGEAVHNAYESQAGRPNNSIGRSQYMSQDQSSRVVLPNRSMVLGERNQNLPLDAQHQSNLAQGPAFVDQTTSMGHNNPVKGMIKEPQLGSLMSRRNRELDQQNPQNNAIPPTLNSMRSNISLYKDQFGSSNHENHSAAPSNQQVPPNRQVPLNQPVPQTNHYRSQNFTPNQQPFAPIHYQVPPSHNRPHIEDSNSYNRGQHSDANYTGKKVFILHFGQAIDDNPILKLGVTLRRMNVDVTLDLFEYDNPPDSWPLWYEQKIRDSDVVLCIITENFYHQLTNSNHVLGYSVYNLMNSSRNIAFRAVFLDARKKEMEYVPPAMRGATCYSISPNNLSPNDDEFANLYAFLTGQNRVQKPELGNMIKLAPKRSRFGHFSGGPGPTYSNSRSIQQQPMVPQMPIHEHITPRSPPPPAVDGMLNVEQANLIFTLLGGDPTPIKLIRSHNKMFMQLATKMTAEWEALSRMLDIRENDVYAIKADYAHSVTEQAVQMFQQWVRKNGSRATLGLLTTAVYDSGPQYWNLLDTINKYAPQQ